MRTLTAIRYVTPLREGGSLPAVVECSDGRLYVVKFRGAGQGPRVLVAELVVGELARALGLSVPEQVFVELDPAFGRNEPDPEIRDLLRASAGLNLGMAFLPGAVTYDPMAPPEVDEVTASRIVLLDGLAMNVDRTARNPNLLVVEGRLWLIDHGAALYFHHDWESYKKVAAGGYPQVSEHVLLPRATRLREEFQKMGVLYGDAVRDGLYARVPDAWIAAELPIEAAQPLRHEYHIMLTMRLGFMGTRWLEEWDHARREHV